MAKLANTIEVKFKGDSKQLSKAIKSLDKATKSLVKSQAKLVTAGKKVETQQKKTSKGLFQLGHSARQTGGAFSVLRSKLLLFNFAMALGLRHIIKFTGEASKVESMKTAFGTLADGGMDATKSLSRLKEATNDTMSEFDLFQQANNAMILGVSQNTDEMAEMFDMAQRLGKALGKDTKESVESLITGIGRQSRLMLDNIGIIVKSNEAYEAYAKQLGVNVDALTDAEKKQAFFNAAMDAAKLGVSKLNVEVMGAEDAFKQFRASASDASAEIGRAFMPQMANMAKLMTDFTDSISISGVQAFARHLTAAGVAFGVYRSAALLAAVATHGFALSVRSLLVSSGIGILVVGIGALTSQILKLTDAFGEEKAKTDALRAQYKKLIDDLVKLHDKRDAMNDVTKDATDVTETQADAEARLLKLQKERDKIAARIAKRMEEMLKSVKASTETLYGESLTFLMARIDTQAQLFEDQGFNEIAITAWAEQQKTDIVTQHLEKRSALYNSFMAGYDTFINSLTDMEMSGKERRERIWESTKAGFTKLLGEMLKDKIKTIIAEKIVVKTAAAANLTLVAIEAKALAALWSPAAFAATLASGGTNVPTAVAAIIAGKAAATAALVGAEYGFDGVVDRPTVFLTGEGNKPEHIKVTPLTGNSGAGDSSSSSIVINIMGGIVQEDYVTNELLPAINKARALA